MHSLYADEKHRAYRDEQEDTHRTMKVLVDGPYGVNFTAFADFETVLLIAGGSGVSEDVSQSYAVSLTKSRTMMLFPRSPLRSMLSRTFSLGLCKG